VCTAAAPVDPPIPVPDVEGADASTRGLPNRNDLSWQQRLIVDSSAVAEAMSQAVHDFRSVLDHLEHTGSTESP
jgi:hypothetical protein